MLAVVGLYEHDIGNDRKARLFLKRAIKLKVDRPKAGIVLAKLRFAEAIQRPAGKTGKLSAQQVSSILEPLRTLRGTPEVGHGGSVPLDQKQTRSRHVKETSPQCRVQGQGRVGSAQGY